MKNHWIFSLVIVMFLSLPSRAEKVLVKVLEDFSSENSTYTYSFMLPNAIYAENGRLIEKGSVISGRIIKAVPPKRLKKDAYMLFMAETYTVPSDDNRVVPIRHKKKSRIKYYQEFKINKKKIAKEAGTTVAGMIVPGLDYGISFAEGAKNAEDGHKFKAGCRGIMEGWPLCYCLKGKEIEIKSGTLAIFQYSKKMFD